ncbi:YjbF family lipoprotein [Vibrio atypicus]|uniref:YjbF family lipoprotein n=1 Tax=Vibrio atypicus TaxID=558271 RepID=UPI00135C18BC|nr:YjbF family lipoprotein [Vibrio atypicus]
MTYLRSALLILILSFLSGCSQRFQDVNATISEGLFGFDDISLKKEQVAELPYASIYARVNQGPQIFMVLGFVDTNPVTGNQQLKWLSSDSAVITTENGRVVKTTALPSHNLLGLSSSTNLAAPNNETTSWQNSYDWQPGYHYGKQAKVESSPVGMGVTTSLLWEKQTSHIREIITFPDSDQQMQNDFWVDNQGSVVKSAQWLVPNELLIEIEVLKPYAE